MSQATQALITTPALPARPLPAQSETKFIESAEYRRLVYKMFRMQGEYRPGRTYNFPAWKALELTRRYVDALR